MDLGKNVSAKTIRQDSFVFLKNIARSGCRFKG